MLWLILTVLAVVSRSFQSITTKLLSTRVTASPMTHSVLFSGVSMLLTVLLIPLLGSPTLGGISKAWPVLLTCVVAQGVGNLLFFKGLQKLEASISAIAFSSILLWGVIFSSILLHASFSGKQFAGIALLGVAIIVVQFRRGKYRLDRAIWYIIFSAFSFAVFQVTSAKLSKSLAVSSYLLLSFLGAALTVYVANIRTVNRELRLLRSEWRRVAAFASMASTCSVGYFVFSYFAYRHAPQPGVVVVLLTAQVILSVLLGIVLLKEKDHIARKLIAAVLAFAASVLIKS